MVVGDFPEERDTIVIGAGPGGYVAAIRAAQLGQKVTIIEKEYYGGVCLNVGCIPSKALITIGHRFEEARFSEHMGVKAKEVDLDFTKAQEWKGGVVNKLTTGVKGLLKKNKVEMVSGEAFFVDEHSLRVIHEDSAQTYTFNNVIIATGSRPIEIPGFKYGKRVLNSTGALALQEVPKKLVVIGGGYIGTELGGAFANLGTELTILEGGPEILPTYEKDMVSLVKRSLKNKNVEIVTKALAKSAEETEDGVKVTYEANGETHTIDADYVLVTVGRRPNTDEIGLEQLGVKVSERGLIEVDKQGRTNIPNVFAIGDIVPGVPLAHKASYEAKVAAEAIAGEKVENDYTVLPAVVFSDPELASVGMTEKESERKRYRRKSIEIPTWWKWTCLVT
ncbi:dihydrolipoamide dehydrogenase [Listeria aquatica FSL S10-1188]|uniref:Dihydrolipoyl dehydrogenase n=1 Tax=Listeria aquatica FSL S10-1188 TaxID=1265818 RepID=W7AWL7_9LIST|nr:dihydrolipoamide dehydrogenase [Listeria aquatica FSL S10-1188]